MKNITIAIAMNICGVAQAADVLIIGEVHDNPTHHRVQADMVGALQPKALVFEMLTADQAEHATAETRAARDTLEQALGWVGSGWPDFTMYYPIFNAAPEARIYGAGMPGPRAGEALSESLQQHFEAVKQRYALDDPLPEGQQSAREALQMAAHCDALPPDLLPRMVDIQRLRNAVLADAVVQALAETGGPVAVITGNGHARRDWGVPALLPSGLDVEVIGQTEEDQPLEGGFDQVFSAPAVDRPDPCAAFQ